MTHKEFLSELHKLSKIDKQQVSALVSALCRVLSEEAIAGNVIEIEGLGQFISHKHPEYIKTDDETGETILFPPRISYRFSSLKNFQQASPAAPLLAEYAGVTEELAWDFLRCFVEVISAKIKDGEEVEVQGLGTFVVVDTQQAEMRRMALILSEKMKRDVNAPFSYFEPYVISKGEERKERGEEEILAKETEPEFEEKEIAASEEVAQEDASQREELFVAQGETLGNEDEKKENPQRGRLTNLWKFIVPAACAVLFLVVFLMVWQSEPKPIPETPVAVIEEIKVEETPEIVADTLQEEEPEKLAPVEENKPEKTAEVSSPAPSPAPDKSLFSHRMKDEAGNPVAVKLEPGGRLTLVALEHFGAKDFWPYIFDVNTDKLKSPNNVSAGMTLYLPDPEYFDIDAASEASLKKARQRGHDINTGK